MDGTDARLTFYEATSIVIDQRENQMTATLPYTVIFSESSGRYTVSYLDLPAGLTAARKTLETDLLLNLHGDKTIVTLIPGTHHTDLSTTEVHLVA